MSLYSAHNTSVSYNPRAFRNTVNAFETPREAADKLFGSSPAHHRTIVNSLSGDSSQQQQEIAQIYDAYLQSQIPITTTTVAPAPQVLTPAQARAAQNTPW